MTEVGLFEAKTRLSALVDQVERGDEILITRHGVAVARLAPLTNPARPTRLNALDVLVRFGQGRKFG
ncbi:MAG TPA: type II toxin-antitoxin system prevent-host-death family antitoxin [Fibrobacteraceae bacterium]|nr:type II toxin-antitoxin system prevent-host-death family antitoxin [Fibrobacteraceae bacterium]